MKTGIELIAEERQRQISQEGWTPEHDDGHTGGEMADAAVCYIETATLQDVVDIPYVSVRDTPEGWPWDYEWWKPSEDPIRNLVKAGALIAAEIDRLQRKEKP